jgi:hypothetical protein
MPAHYRACLESEWNSVPCFEQACERAAVSRLLQLEFGVGAARGPNTPDCVALPVLIWLVVSQFGAPAFPALKRAKRVAKSSQSSRSSAVLRRTEREASTRAGSAPTITRCLCPCGHSCDFTRVGAGGVAKRDRAMDCVATLSTVPRTRHQAEGAVRPLAHLHMPHAHTHASNNATCTYTNPFVGLGCRADFRNSQESCQQRKWVAF